MKGVSFKQYNLHFQLQLGNKQLCTMHRLYSHIVNIIPIDNKYKVAILVIRV